MRIDDRFAPFLQGTRFSNGLTWRVATPSFVVATRIELLQAYAKGKRVLHVGFADHLPLIEEKIRADVWLHARLAQVAERCLGVDINEEAVGAIRDRFGFRDVLAADITRAVPSEVANASWDVVVLGDVVEHLDNPGAFLAAIRARIPNGSRRLVVSVPNAWAFLNLRLALTGRECVNTDHRYWFSPFTLSRLIAGSGWRPIEMTYCEPSRWWSRPRALMRPSSLVHRLCLTAFPSMAETLVVVAEPM